MARFRALALVLAATATLVVAGCASIAALPGPMPTADPIPHPTEPEAPSGTVANPQVVAIGDSIMKGYGLQPSQPGPNSSVRQPAGESRTSPAMAPDS